MNEYYYTVGLKLEIVEDSCGELRLGGAAQLLPDRISHNIFINYF